MNIPNSYLLKRIVIIGSGFGGLQVATKLSNRFYQIVLIDKNNYHTFQPLLYQVATFGLEPDSIAKSIRFLIRKRKNFFFRLAKVNFIDINYNIIYSNIGELEYDYLIIATGSKTNFFGNKNIEKFSLPLKNIGEALNLRNCILHSIEYALSIRKKKIINFIIVGGGPTGVELAGSLAELKYYILPKYYPELDLNKINIHLIQATKKLLDGMSESSSNIALNYIKKMGVNVWLNNPVKNYDGKTIFTKKVKLKSYNVIWAAGVKGAIIKGLGNKYIANNRILVDKYHKVQGINNLFAIGDVAVMKEDNKYPNGHPMIALPAIQQGINLAKNFNRFFFKKKIQPFKFKNKGYMAIIGRNKAVCDLSYFTISGSIAWILWMIIHLMKIQGFRNKLLTLINWITQYFNYNKSISILIRPYINYNNILH
ncbi:MAG: NAD(P)/FAD-dependent oxidoreductase [Candidatus Sulcia muelleri]|uniref:NADH:ubiquinone reductase (non-electrogenic) n=1 Tax=Karelsulcia muelleri (strain GWSS) TaxID=444179 RepID=A8Z6C0_KARMG|nr:putative type II NADH dehydrogenase [Candidatus Karelsulcia muelleri GWSS]MCJ7422587.1 NAD(P)/FAD-dependent oxidoreductase [Candidatus Karelsulcia muelleri]MCJ7468701.1 NAD(P)/FAD-dependent oxidoreductase [Candidatus Karelsulcia muelleri]